MFELYQEYKRYGGTLDWWQWNALAKKGVVLLAA